MKALFPVLFILLISTGVEAQTNFILPVDGTDCSNLLFKALLEEDANAISNLVANEFTLAGFQGRTINGTLLKQAVSEGAIVIDSGMLTGTNSRSYGDVTLVSGLWDVQAKIENNSFRSELSYLTVCVKSGGRWKIVAMQLTPVQ